MTSEPQFETYPREITGLNVMASQSYPIELANGRGRSPKRRVEVRAAVDIQSGEVRFYVDPADVPKLLRNTPDEASP